MRKYKPFPFTQAYLKSILRYDKKTGIFIWKYRPDMSDGWNTRWAGKQAGSMKSEGYVDIGINGIHYLAHRLAWFYIKGTQPPEIDHRNNNFDERSNNSMANLRPSTHTENLYNISVSANNTSGYKGVDWHKRETKWRARIKVNSKRIHLGYFDSPEAASAAYIKAAKKYHGEFARWDEQ